MVSIEMVVTVVWMVMTIVGFIPLYLDYFQRSKEYEDNIIIIGYHEHPNDPSSLRLTIRNLNTTTIYIDKVMYNKHRLRWLNHVESRAKRIIEPGGGITVLVPKEIQTENAEIRIMNGKKTLKRIKFEDIQINQ